MHYFRYITTFLIAVSSYLLVPGEVRADYTYTIDFETNNLGVVDPDLDDDAIQYNTEFTDPNAPLNHDLTITFEANYEDNNSGFSSSAFEDYYVSSATANAYGYTANLETDESSGVSGFGTANYVDQPATGYEQQAGNFFMRSAAPMNIIRIANSGVGTVTEASGEIWDIDNGWGTEDYNVYAYSISGSDYTLLAKQLSSDGGTQGDGTPWSWSFSGLTEGIDAIVVYQRGQQFNSNAPGGWTTGAAVGIGLGTGFWNNDVSGDYKDEKQSHANYFVNFDNLSFTVTPEPSSLLAFSGVVSLAFLRRRRRSPSLLGNQESDSAA